MSEEIFSVFVIFLFLIHVVIWKLLYYGWAAPKDFPRAESEGSVSHEVKPR